MSNTLYYVEGECEKNLLKSFMYVDGYHFQPGRVSVFNFINQEFPLIKARSIPRGSKIAIAIDTDVKRIDLLKHNLKMLERHADIPKKDIVFLMSKDNLEEELLFACSSLSRISQLFNTNGKAEFKKQFASHQDLHHKLLGVGFDPRKMWTRVPDPPFDIFTNGGKKIVIKK